MRATIEACDGVLSLLVGQNRNVLIETGIAIALRKPLFVLAQTLQDAGMLMDNFPVVLLGDQAMLRRELKAFADRLSSAGPRFQ
jgi:hypothetical protein